MQDDRLRREMRDRLPSVLADLFPKEAGPQVRPGDPTQRVDAIAEVHGAELALLFEPASRPGLIDAASTRADLSGRTRDDIAIVVPYMTSAGERAARERDLNWIDLSGNAHLFGESYYVHVRGQPNQFRQRGRPSSPFAPKSARVTRALLLDPERWWRQADLAEHTRLDDGQVSRVVRALDADHLLARDGRLLHPRDPDLLLDAWSEDYAFDRHDVVSGHLSGSGAELTEALHDLLREESIGHAFTGLPAAWLLDRHARFRLCSVFVDRDPRAVADAVGLRREERGANVQLLFPDDRGVFDGQREIEGVPIVAPVQVYLDLQALPERAEDAAVNLRSRLWDGR